MKLTTAVAVAVLGIVPTLAAAQDFTVDFEHRWDYLAGGVNGYYGGGTAADGATGPNLGITFSNLSGLSNDADFTYYSGAPTMLGVAYAYAEDASSRSFMNIAAGATGALSFYYASTASIAGAIRAYSGLDGTGSLLGSFNLVGNNTDTYGMWSLANFGFSGIARSFDFTGSANGPVAFDNVSGNVVAVTPVPEPDTLALMLAGAAALVGVSRRRRRG